VRGSDAGGYRLLGDTARHTSIELSCNTWYDISRLIGVSGRNFINYRLRMFLAACFTLRAANVPAVELGQRSGEPPTLSGEEAVKRL